MTEPSQPSQSKFARPLDVDVYALRNREQGRRQPLGQARPCWDQSSAIRNRCVGHLISLEGDAPARAGRAVFFSVAYSRMRPIQHLRRSTMEAERG